jgi:integrase
MALDSRCQIATPWRLHDLRRTVATRMADIGIQPHIIEAVLNHSAATRPAWLEFTIEAHTSAK